MSNKNVIKQIRGFSVLMKTAHYYTVSQKKGDTILLSISLLNIDRFSDFHNSFNDVLSWNCAIKLLIKIQSHLRCVATLPCEMFQQDCTGAQGTRDNQAAATGDACIHLT